MTRRTVPVRGVSTAAGTVYGEAVFSGVPETFSNAAAAMGATAPSLLQIGTMSAPRVVTLPAANAVPAGWVALIADASGTVTNPFRVTLAAAGADSLVGMYPVIHVPYGFLRVVSDGASKWTVFDSATPGTYWRWNEYDVTQFTLDMNQAGTNSTIAKITGAMEPYAPMIELNSVGGGSAGYRAWKINDVDLSKRSAWSVNFRMGKRSANIIPNVHYAYQDATHAFALARDSGTPANGYFMLANGAAFNSSVYSSSFVLGTNSTATGIPGASVSLRTYVRHPDGVDPAVSVYALSHTESGVNSSNISSKSSAFTGGTPPSSSWGSGWTGFLGAAIGCYGTATADTSQLADLSITAIPGA